MHLMPLTPSTVIEPPKDKDKNSPYAVLYKLGWVLSGSPAHNSYPLNHGALNNFFIQNDSTFCHSCSEIFRLTKNETLELSPDQQKFMKHASENIRLNDNHHFEMKLPLKNPHLKVYSNKEQALQRLHCLSKKLTKNQKLYTQYKDYMIRLGK